LQRSRAGIIHHVYKPRNQQRSVDDELDVQRQYAGTVDGRDLGNVAVGYQPRRVADLPLELVQ